MAHKKYGTKLRREAFKSKKNLLNRRTPDKKLNICVEHTELVHPDYVLPSHCCLTTSPDHQSIMGEFAHIDSSASAGLSPEI